MDARSTTFIMNISQNVVDNETKYNIGILPDSFFNNASDNDTISTFGTVPEPPLYLLVTISSLMAIIFIVGIVGNIVVVIVIGCNRNMRSVVNTYLMNLCVADLLLLILCMPAALSELIAKDAWIFGEFMCKFLYILCLVAFFNR